MYKVARASEYLVVTGVGIPDIKIAKKAWILPGQCLEIIDVSPVNYTFEVQAVSAEKLPFVLPAAFIVGPHFDDNASLLKYAKLISPHDKLPNHVKDLVQGIIEGWIMPIPSISYHKPKSKSSKDELLQMARLLMAQAKSDSDNSDLEESSDSSNSSEGSTTQNPYGPEFQDAQDPYA